MIDKDFICCVKGCGKERYMTVRAYSIYCEEHERKYHPLCSTENCERRARDKVTGKCVLHGGTRRVSLPCKRCNTNKRARCGLCRECYVTLTCSYGNCMNTISVNGKNLCYLHKKM